MGPNWTALLIHIISHLIGTICAIRMKQEHATIQLPFSTYMPLKNPIFYHTYIPVLFKFSLPSISTYSSVYMALCERDEDPSMTPAQVIQAERYNCTDDDTEPSSSSQKPTISAEESACAALKHLSEIFESHEQTHRPWKPLPKFRKSDFTHLDLIPCDEIGPHFDDFKIGPEHFEQYESRLEECHFGESLIVIPEPAVEERTDFEQLMVAARNSSAYASENHHRYDSGVSVDSVVALQQASISHLQLERSKWSEAFSDCRAHLIPTTLIDYLGLSSALDIANETASSNNLQFSIPNLHGYYSLPLSDCVLLEETNFIVRVLIPVMTAGEVIQLVRVTSVPSVLVMRGNFYEICDAGSGAMIWEQNRNLILATSCRSNRLCFLDGTEWRSDSIPAHCMRSHSKEAISGYRTSDSDSCKSQCRQVSSIHFPILRRAGPDQFVIILGAMNSSIQVECEDDVSGYNRSINFTRSGTILMELPCGCEVIANVVHRSVSPCSDSNLISITHLSSAAPRTIGGDGGGHNNESPKFVESETESVRNNFRMSNYEETAIIIRQLGRGVHYLWLFVIALSSLVLMAILVLSWFALRMKRMRRDFIKSNDHRSTFYSFTDIAVTRETIPA